MADTAHRVAGKVLVKEGAVGVPDLVVTLFAPSERNLRRLGSTLTDAKGAFSLEHDVAGVDLTLEVSAPDEGDAANRKPLARQVRQAAGRIENYVIRIPEAALEAAGVAVPVGDDLSRTESRAGIPTVARLATEVIAARSAMRDIAKSDIARSRTEAATVDEAVEKRLLGTLGVVTGAEAERLRLVPRGESAEPRMRQVIAHNIREVVNRQKPRLTYVLVPDAELPRFRDGGGNYRADVRVEELAPWLYGTSHDSRPPVLRRTERDHQGDGDDTIVFDEPPEPPPAPPPPSDTPPALADDHIQSLLGRLTTPMTAPEAAVSFASATDASVQSHIHNFSLAPGPADTPATYDFHELAIAFDYVWQQAIDEGIISTARELGRFLHDSGADPVAALGTTKNPVEALRSETEHVVRSSTFVQRVSGMTSLARPGGLFGGSFGPASGWGGILPELVADADTLAPPRPTNDPRNLLAELDAAMRERYKFEIFAPGSTNFGLVVTYRQRWEPLAYQVGDLVRTITLAPKETRKVTSRRVVKKERSAREVEENLRIRKDELSDAARSEAEIVQKAQAKTGFNYTTKGSFDIKLASGDVTTGFTRDADTASQETKKSFHEAVMKAAQEFKDERRLEVETKELLEDEVTEVAEITNPNDELPVTFLFYELQRRFRTSEHIERVVPVVLVALDVPSPTRREIEKTLVTHSWIINRVLLDDRYRAPLEYLCKRVVGEEIALAEQSETVRRLRKLVDGLKARYADIQRSLTLREAALQRAMEVRAEKAGAEGTEGMGEKAWEWVVGSGDEESIEAARLREEAAKEAYEKAVREERELRMRLDSEAAALQSATDSYAKARALHANKELEIAGLRVHFKENVLYYMQAIWSMSHGDQLFFSLHRTRAPILESRTRTYALAAAANPPPSIIVPPGQTLLEARLNIEIADDLDNDRAMATLAELADLGKLLGFKGNYAVFPLKRSNALTDFMMHPYLDAGLGLRDPDDAGNFTPKEFADHARRVYAEARATATPAELAELEARLKEQYARIVTQARRAHDEVCVPSGSLFIEALPGTHAILEPFKLIHRAIDVKKVQAEVRRLELENVRYAARVLGDELEDPDVERRIVVDDGVPIVVNDDR